MVAAPKENNKSAEKVTLSSVVFSSLSSFIVPWLALCVLALILFAFFGVDVPGMFDKMADMDVADIGAKCFRPLIAATVCGITYYFTSNLDIMVGALLVYQVLLLLLRTKQLGSFRAAIVEMLYLTMIASIFVLVIIPLIFFSDRGSKKSSKRKSDDDDEILISDQYGHSVRVRKTGMNTYSFVFRSLNRTFDLRSKVGCTSEMKRKTSFSFAFRSVCTTFAPNIIEKEICNIRIILGKQECSNR